MCGSTTPTAPPQNVGPINTPLPSTVSGSRVAIALLAGNGEWPNEGHFRPLEVVTRPGSMFHPLPPAPCFLYAWPTFQAIETIYNAVAKALPGAVPACSGGDICSLVWWGVRRETGEPWADGAPHPIGQGGSVHGDGASSLIHHGEASTRISPTEVWESKNPWLLEKIELRTDSCGAGRHRGGLGLDLHFRLLEDSYVTAAIERTKNPPWGLVGGEQAAPSIGELVLADGTRSRFGKATRLLCPAGSTLELHTGGGGGYGPACERAAEAVHADIREGYTTPEHARRHYPHAFESEGSP